MHLLLLSNSTNAGQGYLDHAGDLLAKHFADTQRVLFVPYAGVRIDWDEYVQKTQEAFPEGVEVVGIHSEEDPQRAVREAEAIAVAGGNTFQLVRELHRQGLVEVIRERVQNGLPYAGWSAGANLACPKLSTTNDMPIVEPASHETLGLIPFQINPHYLDAHAEGHMGESREVRILEYVEVNRTVPVLGLREGTWLQREGDHLSLHGPKPARLFRYGQEPEEVEPGDLSQLLA